MSIGTMPISILIFLVLTSAEVKEQLPSGTSRAVAEQYLIEEAESFRFVAKGNESIRGVFEWQENEVGYLLASVSYKRFWWDYIFGVNRMLTILVGISSDDRVTQVETTGSVTGLP